MMVYSLELLFFLNVNGGWLERLSITKLASPSSHINLLRTRIQELRKQMAQIGITKGLNSSDIIPLPHLNFKTKDVGSIERT